MPFAPNVPSLVRLATIAPQDGRVAARVRVMPPGTMLKRMDVSRIAALGWQAHLWVDDADSLEWLTEICGR